MRAFALSAALVWRKSDGSSCQESKDESTGKVLSAEVAETSPPEAVAIAAERLECEAWCHVSRGTLHIRTKLVHPLSLGPLA